MLNSYVDLKLQCPHRTRAVDSPTLNLELFTCKQAYPLEQSHAVIYGQKTPILR